MPGYLVGSTLMSGYFSFSTLVKPETRSSLPMTPGSRPTTRTLPEAPIDRERFFEQLDIIRATGYAVDEGEDEEGSCCIAAPIFNDKGNAIAAISLSAPESRMAGAIRQTICAQLIPTCKTVADILRGTVT